ncbi:MAG: RNA polymerase factor sigma-54 [Chromatiales bacterium 21-64-14]|nr:MAG: RNA polymerase factor sigma-54 [Chromatiales bacterium 21-64-14]HQU14946.1 RNA polymerase factor sigma-54 [Gammaproteobacteria bacterium]
MKQSIQLRLGQHLAMTPQLQQAIRLLQMSTMELQLEIQRALDSNLMLESADEAEDEAGTEGNGATAAMDADTGPRSEPSADAEPAPERETIPEDLPVDSAWDDIYDTPASHSSASDDGSRETEIQGRVSETLHDHLMWQMNLTPFSDTDLTVAIAIIDAIDDDGYLSSPLEEIHQGVNDEIEADLELTEVEAVLHRIQNFDPVGCGARDLRESLMLQLQQFAPETPALDGAKRIVQDHLDLLGKRDYAQIMRHLKLSAEDLEQAAELIRSLNPRPGSRIAGPPPEYVVPDVFVRKYKDVWRVELNLESTPRLRVNPYYAGLVRRADDSADNNYLKNHLQEARWFIKSLQNRNETLLKVASCIVERQRAFLEHGDESMRPLVLREVADTVSMHESTISRITTQKYMHTPRGIYEFKYFFSSHVGTADGGECSATAIRAKIKKLISSEGPEKPLSDSKIAELLSKEGIPVARRTVAKYREAMSIPPSNERKHLR